MALTPVPTPAIQRGDRATFASRVDAFVTWLTNATGEFDALASGVSALAAGGAYSIPYIFDATTTDADPTAGKLRLSSATQNASTVLRLDLTGSDAKDWTSVLDTFDASTSTVKGAIRLVKMGDASKWLTFNVTARAAPAGYRNFTIVNTGGSTANPFTNGDSLMLFFQRTGDKGDMGATSGFSNMVVLTTTQTWTPPAGIIKVKRTIIDGGDSGVMSGTAPSAGGAGGRASVAVIVVDPAVTYTATVGAKGAIIGTAGSSSPSQAGGASSFSGAGIATQTSANGAVVIPGGAPIRQGSSDPGYGGGSLYAPPAAPSTTPTGFGGGGAGVTTGSLGKSGADGAIILEY